MKLKIQKNKRKLKFLANDKLEEMAEAKKNNNIEESDYEKLLTKYGSRDLVVINAGITHILKKTIQFSDQVIFFKSI